jgi:hypothetical protein
VKDGNLKSPRNLTLDLKPLRPKSSKYKMLKTGKKCAPKIEKMYQDVEKKFLSKKFAFFLFPNKGRICDRIAIKFYLRSNCFTNILPDLKIIFKT